MGERKLSLEVVFDYAGDPQFYEGHGHVFESKNVIACIRFGFPIDYSETVEEIIERVLDDVHSTIEPIEFLGEAEENPELQKEIRKFVTDENIRQAIIETLPKDVKLSDKFFEVGVEKVSEEEIFELPMLIGYIHVWRE